jgi:hypothetical protein
MASGKEPGRPKSVRARCSEPAFFSTLLLRGSYFVTCTAPIGSEKVAVRVAIGEPPAGYL